MSKCIVYGSSLDTSSFLELSAQASVFRFGLLQNRHVCIGIFPQRNEVFILLFRCNCVTCKDVSARELQLRKRPERVVGHQAAMIDELLELCGRFFALS